MSTDKRDDNEARGRADALRADPKVRAWMRRARKLMREIPPSVWIYWQEDECNMMAEGPSGERYRNMGGDGTGTSQAAIVDSFRVPGSDAGAW